MKKTILILFLIICLLVPSLTIAEAPVYIQKNSFTKPDGKTNWVDASPFEEGEKLLKVDFVGIRQGDCIFIRYDDQVMLIDGGEDFRIDAVQAYLNYMGITHINAFFNTHAHDDHLDCEIKLFNRNWGPDIQYSPYGDNEDYCNWKSYAAKLAAAGIPRVKLVTGDKIDLGDAVMEIWRQNLTSVDRMNNHSIISKLTYGDASMLFTGDISADAEEWMMTNFGTEILKADILKAPHHGLTHMVAQFLDGVAPELVVITNQLGPAQDTVKQLKKRNIAYFNINYLIHCETNGSIWYVWLEKMPAVE